MNGDKATLLLVEDEILIGLNEQHQLEQAGYRVIHAASGEAAIRLAEDGAQAIDLVLMDIDLGRAMDGTEAARIILGERDLPLLFLSSHTEPEIVARTEAITNYGYVVKNSSITVLDASIKMAFKLFEAKRSIAAQGRAIEEANDLLRKANEELRQSEARYRSLFQHLNSSFSLYEVVSGGKGEPRDYRYLAVNPAYEATIGRAAASLVGRTLLEVFPGTEPSWLETFAGVVATGIPARIESRSGELDRHFEIYAYVPQPGQLALLGADISDRRQAEEALRESEALLNATERLSATGGWEYDVLRRSMTWTREAFVIHGLDPGLASEDAKERIGASASCFRPEDRPRILAAFGACLSDGIAYDLELPFTDMQGREKWIRTTANPVREDGRVVKVIGNIMDITERKRTEESLRSSREQYKLIDEASLDSIYSYDLQGRFTHASSGLCRLLGKPAEEIVGRSHEELGFPPERCAEWAELHRRVAATDATLVSETETPIPGSDSRYFEVVLSPMHGPDGAVVGIAGTTRDITLRKRAERELDAKNRLLTTLLDNLPIGVLMVEAPSGKPLVANEAARRLLGSGILPDVSRESAAEVYRAYRRGGGEAYPFEELPIVRGLRGESSHVEDMEVERPDGGRSLLEVYGCPLLDAEGRVTASIVSFLDISETARAEEEVRQLLVEKELILKEVHHRVKNNMAIIGSLITMNMDRISDPGAASILSDAASRLRGMMVLYDRLYRSEDARDLSLADFFGSLVREIVAMFDLGRKVGLDMELDELRLDARLLSSLGIVVNEMITNSMKHAFAACPEPRISLRARAARGRLRVEYRDNGSGLPAEAASASGGFGMQLMEMLVAQMKGRLAREAGPGARFVVELPL